MTTARKTQLGAFVLGDLLGSGAMGSVWQAVHIGEGVEVAIKVVTAEHADDPGYRMEFRREVEAVAGLEHPGIVRVYDYGRVDGLVARTSDGALREGGPWLAMEHARWGNLNRIPVDSWGELRIILYDLLDALAHAHARGVVHRDLKPANVLASEAADGQLVLKLSDFGVAHIHSDDVESPEASAGTPVYMAPEQFLARARDQGPWTDLYALGCVAYELVTGQPPFIRPQLLQLAYAHIHEEVTQIGHRFSTPDGFDAWLLRLLAKSPSDRFRFAADARRALRSLDPAHDSDDVRLQVADDPRETFATGIDWAVAETLPLAVRAAGELDDTGDGPDPTVEFGRPAAVDVGDAPLIPRDWRVADPPSGRALLSGVGLGLFGLRAIPFVGRHEERDSLWQGLRAVQREKRPLAIVVEGVAGAGKSRLVRWIFERAHELGAAECLSATHSPMAGGTGALRQMASRWLACENLTRDEVFRRLSRRFGPTPAAEDDAAALASLLCPPDEFDRPAESPLVRFGSDEERYLVLARMLRRASTARPALVWLDDVQWGGDALAFVLDVVSDQPDLPVLFAMTARTESIEDRRREASLYRQLVDHRGVQRLVLGPLDEAERTEQIQRMLRLPDDLVERLARRSEGNPLFAVHLVGDWVQRGVLAGGPAGFEIAGDGAEIPDDIHDLWLRRLADVGRRFGADATTALRVAAALGLDVDAHEWERACELLGTTVPAGLVDGLVSRRLARRLDDGWSFEHGMFRESIEREARESSGWASANSACAAMLDVVYSDPEPSVLTRRGVHLLEAQLYEMALDVLLDAGAHHFQRENLTELERTIGLAEGAIRESDVSRRDHRRGKVLELRRKLLSKRGDFAAADELNALILIIAELFDWEEERAAAIYQKGSTTALDGDVEEGRRLLLESAEVWERLGDLRPRADAIMHLSHVYGLRGDSERAVRFGREAHDAYHELDDATGMAWSLYYLGLAHRLAGNLDEAARHLDQALERAERAGLRDLQANCFNVRADVHRMAGELGGAREGYRHAISIWRAIGSANVSSGRLNLAFTSVQDGVFVETRELLLELLDTFRDLDQMIPLAACHAALLPCDAAIGALDAFDEHAERARELLAETGLVDPDVAMVLQRALKQLPDADARRNLVESLLVDQSTA